MKRAAAAALAIGSALAALACSTAGDGPPPTAPPDDGEVAARYDRLAPETTAKLRASIEAAEPHPHHVWRDTSPFNADGTLNGYVEIARGELVKYEFDIARNRLEPDRELPAELVGYPTNYGFAPQTMSYDGDPFDVLVLGPALPRGTIVAGRIVGLLYMEDEKGPDMKVVISPVDGRGRPLHALSEAEKARVGAWFDGYKRWEADRGKWSKVTGWGDAQDGRRFVDTTHRFFAEAMRSAQCCAERASSATAETSRAASIGLAR